LQPTKPSKSELRLHLPHKRRENQHQRTTNQFSKTPQNPKMSQPIEKLTSVMLTGKNYHMWTRQATFGLIGRDKIELVNDERPTPISKKKTGELTEEEKKALREWRRDDNKVRSWLIAIMKPIISEVMSY
jgi:hypothetical protein